MDARPATPLAGAPGTTVIAFLRKLDHSVVFMIEGKKVIVVMPAYNAAKTLEKTLNEIDRTIVDEVILVDDRSKDETPLIAKNLGIKTIVHTNNLGYGGNQKTCYRAALESGADIVIMVHPDYQYTPKLIPSLAWPIATGLYDSMLGSRILGGTALAGGMPLYKYIANRFLTLSQNLLMGQKLSEYHTGYRAFRKEILEKLPLGECSDDFIFDNEMIAQIFYHGYQIGEVSCPTKYFAEASSINLTRSIRYGLGVLGVSLLYFFSRLGLVHPKLFSAQGLKLEQMSPRGYPL